MPSTLVWSYTLRACMCCTWQGSVVSDSSYSSGWCSQIWSVVVPLYLDERVVGGWLRAFINLINFFIYSALTFESITTVCDFPACYRPVLPAGFACQVVLKTNSTSLPWRELLPQSRWSINKQANKTTSSQSCLFVCLFLKKACTQSIILPQVLWWLLGCLPGADRDSPAIGVLSLLSTETSISPSLFHISQLLERRLLLSCTPSKYAFLWGLQIPTDPGITFSRIPSQWGQVDPCLPCSVSSAQVASCHPAPLPPCSFPWVSYGWYNLWGGVVWLLICPCYVSEHQRMLAQFGIRKTDSLLPSRRKIRNVECFYLLSGM